MIPPIVLQGCAPKVAPSRISINQYGGYAVGAHVRGFDLSFVNTTNKVVKLVMIRIGGTDFAELGTFSPGVVIAKRIAAHEEGECLVTAVRFEDGTEWAQPQ